MADKEQKRMEREVMRNAPKSAKELHKCGCKLKREQARKEWWNKNKPAGY
jgi:hypothetical protein